MDALVAERKKHIQAIEEIDAKIHHLLDGKRRYDADMQALDEAWIGVHRTSFYDSWDTFGSKRFVRKGDKIVYAEGDLRDNIFAIIHPNGNLKPPYSNKIIASLEQPPSTWPYPPRLSMRDLQT